jgi:hypothetical protein
MDCNIFSQQLQLSPGCRLAARPAGAINILLLSGIITQRTVLVRRRLIQDVASHSSCKKGMTGHYRYHATLISVCRRWIHTHTSTLTAESAQSLAQKASRGLHKPTSLYTERCLLLVIYASESPSLALAAVCAWATTTAQYYAQGIFF